MITISDDLKNELESDSQRILPKVKAWMSDIRYADNLKFHSPSMTYEKQISSRSPLVHIKMDKTNYDALTVSSTNSVTKTVTSINVNTDFITKNTHGLSNGNVIKFKSTKLLPQPLAVNTTYYVVNKTTDTFQVSATSGGSPIDITTPETGVLSFYYTSVTISLVQSNSQTVTSVNTGTNFITKNVHGLNNGDVIGFTTTTTLPSPLAANTNYYVVNKGTNNFQVSTTSGGSAVDITTTGTGTHSFHYRRTQINSTAHGLENGAAVWFSTTGVLADITESPDSRGVVYYVQNKAANTFELNTSFAYSNSGVASTSVPYTGASTGVIDFTSLRNGGHRVFDYGSEKMEVAYRRYDDFDPTPNPLLNTNYSIPSYNISDTLTKEILEPERIEDTFTITSTRLGTSNLGQFGSKNMYSWRISNAKDIWTIPVGSAVCKSSRSGVGYLLYNLNSLDHYVDFKFSTLYAGSGAVVRYINDDNYISAWYSTISGGTIFIRLVKDGTAYPITSVAGSFSTSHYYRFEAKYNTFTLYDLGTVKPDDDTSPGSGDIVVSVYRDDDSLKSLDATYVGAGNTSAISNGAAIDYLAVKGFNYITGGHVFDGTGYCFSSTNMPNTTREQFKNISSDLTNFTYSFLVKKDSTTTGINGIFWIGNTDNTRSIDCYWGSADNKIYVRHTNTSSVTNTLSSATLSPNTLYNVQIVKNNGVLSVYIDNVLSVFSNAAAIALPLKDTSTGLTPMLMIGAGKAVSDYDIFNGTISNFAVFDYALSDTERECLNKSITNEATLNSQLSDEFFTPQRVADMFHEETLTYAFTNFLDNKNNVIQTNGDYYCPEPKVSIDTNYGWMSRVQTDGSSNFTSPDFIEMSFNSLKCNKIFISTGYLSGGIFSADCIITKSDGSTLPSTAYPESSSTLQFADIDGNCFSYLAIDLDDVYDIISIRITPNYTCNAYDYARIFTINPIWEVDLSDHVISFDVSKVRDNYDASLPIGATASNSASVVLDNTDIIFSPYSNSAYSKYVNPDTKFFLYFSHEITKTQNFEDVTAAEEMYADSWSFDDSSMQVTVTLRDYSKYLQEQNIDGYISRGYSAGKSIADLLMLSGFPRRKIYFEQKYVDLVFRDKPSVFFYLDALDSIMYSLSLSDFAGFFKDEFGEVLLRTIAPYRDDFGSGLVYSDILSVQDDIKRQVDDLAIKTFEPKYRNGSASFDGILGGPMFYNNVEESQYESLTSSDYWKDLEYSNYTTEFFHYIESPDLMTVDTDYEIISFPSIYKVLVRKNSSSQFIYKFQSTISSTVYTITADAVDSVNPHLITVVNSDPLDTGGGYFRLYVDGIKAAGTFGNPSVMMADVGAFLQLKCRSYYDGFKTYVSNFAYYDYVLSDQDILNHHRTSSISIVPNFKYLYAKDSTYWDAMLKIATADLGMFYINEYGDFYYEYRNTLHQSEDNRYQISQYNFSDDVNIVTGSFVTEVQTNKINVKVNKSSFNASKTEQIWYAETMESLVVSKITADISPTSNFIPLSNVDDPVWVPSGYVKIDDEIIKYSAINKKKLVNIERGMFGTTPAWHQSQSRAREARYYKVEYSASPAGVVNYPAITQEQFEKAASIDYFVSNNFGAEIVVSANDPGLPVSSVNNIDYYFKRGTGYSSVIILQGQDPLSGDDNIFEISGVPINTSQSKEVVNTLSADLANNIRRFRLKEITIDNEFIANKNYAQIVADTIIGYFSNPVKIINISCLGVPHLELGDLVTITNFDALGISNEKYWIIENKITYDGGIKQDLVLRQYSESIDNPELKFTTY
jgi:hypothetical protein